MLLLLNPLWPSMTLNHKILSHLRALYTHNLGILTFRSHPIVEPGPQPPQVELIPTQADSVPKVSAIRKEVRRVFREEEDDAWAAHILEVIHVAYGASIWSMQEWKLLLASGDISD
jgi:hypothetical protein